MSVISGPEEHNGSNGLLVAVGVGALLVAAAVAVGSGGNLDRSVGPQAQIEQEQTDTPNKRPALEAGRLLCADVRDAKRMTGNVKVSPGDTVSAIADSAMPDVKRATEKVLSANHMNSAAAKKIQPGDIIGIPPANCKL